MDKGGAKAERGYPGPTRGKVEKSRNKLKKFNLFRISREKKRNFVRHCRRNRQHCCQKRQQCRSNIFDFVERIVQLVAFDNVASILLLVWTGLLQSCLLLWQCCFVIVVGMDEA